MSAIKPAAGGWLNGRPPPLENGDRLTRAEFERRYEAMPHLKKAELIEGIVYIPPPMGFRAYGEPTAHVIGWLGVYGAGTPGVAGSTHGSTRLDSHNEFQPDGVLLFDPEQGGQTRISSDDFLEGAPELVAEIAASNASIALNAKLRVYCRSGVLEYIVWRTSDEEIDWFVLREGRYDRLPPGADGVTRSEIFPGLWLDSAALLRGDLAAVLSVVQRGIASPEHAAFVARLNPPAPPGGPTTPLTA